MSMKSKGRRSRYKVEDYFREKGYLVADTEKSGSKYIKERDLFALSQDGEYSDKGFDLIALGKGNVIFIQVCSNKPKSQSFYRDFAKQYADGYVEILVTTVEDYDGIRCQWYESDGSITETYIEKQDIPRRYK